MDEPQVPRDPDIISEPADLVDALVRAFVDGDSATCQHIVDTLGDHSQRR